MNTAESQAAPSVIKSAGRVLAVLEAFQTWRRSATAREISRTLKIPRSSTNALLSSLLELGYLWFDRETNTYFPTLKVGLLGDWLVGSLRGDPVLNGILQDISTDTGETVAIAVRTGFDMQFVTIIPSSFPVALNITEGALADLFESAVGIAWLATQEPLDIEHLVAARHQQKNVDHKDLTGLMPRVDEARKRGAAVAYEKVLPDTGAIAVAYGRPVQGQTLVIGIGGPQDRIRRSEARFVELMQRHVRRSIHRAHTDRKGISTLRPQG